MSRLRLLGFAPSVYTRVIRLVLAEKGLNYTYSEVDPFAESVDGHPFDRVPVLRDGDFTIYETSAIARYLDAAFPEPVLTPTDPRAAARMTQVSGLVDAYGYWPMVRQVFTHCVYRKIEGLETDAQEIERGMTAAAKVLNALEDVSQEGLVLTKNSVTLADCHLAPMMAAFAATAEGAEALSRRAALAEWWSHWSGRPSMRATDPGHDAATRDHRTANTKPKESRA